MVATEAGWDHLDDLMFSAAEDEEPQDDYKIQGEDLTETEIYDYNEQHTEYIEDTEDEEFIDDRPINYRYSESEEEPTFVKQTPRCSKKRKPKIAKQLVVHSDSEPDTDHGRMPEVHDNTFTRKAELKRVFISESEDEMAPDVPFKRKCSFNPESSSDSEVDHSKTHKKVPSREINTVKRGKEKADVSKNRQRKQHNQTKDQGGKRRKVRPSSSELPEDYTRQSEIKTLGGQDSPLLDWGQRVASESLDRNSCSSKVSKHSTNSKDRKRSSPFLDSPERYSGLSPDSSSCSSKASKRSKKSKDRKQNSCSSKGISKKSNDRKRSSPSSDREREQDLGVVRDIADHRSLGSWQPATDVQVGSPYDSHIETNPSNFGRRVQEPRSESTSESEPESLSCSVHM